MNRFSTQQNLAFIAFWKRALHLYYYIAINTCTVRALYIEVLSYRDILISLHPWKCIILQFSTFQTFYFCEVLPQVARCAAVSLGWVSHAKRGLWWVRTTAGYTRVVTPPTADSEMDSAWLFIRLNFCLQKCLQNVHWMLEHFSRFNYFETVFCLFGHSGFYLMFVVPLIDVFCIIYNTLWKVRFKMHAFLICECF